MPRITHLEWSRLDVPLDEPFGIATGAQTTAENLVLELGCDDGSRGLGEAAPFPAVNGETRALAERALAQARPALLGLELEPWRHSCAAAAALLAAPSALCAFETALLDAAARGRGISLLEWFGAAETALETDITLTTGDAAQARAQALRAAALGFRRLKIKVGGAALAHDEARIREAASAAPEAELLLDANASLTSDAAIELLRRLGEFRERVVLFEQPTPAGDLEGLRRVRGAGVKVAADESVKHAADVGRLADARAADVVNLKIMKAGVTAAFDAALEARRRGLGLMIGGMVETRLAMTVSACLAAGLGGFSFVDLDTPLFLAWDPFDGGFEMKASTLELGGIRLGHGVSRKTGLPAAGC